MQLQTICQGGPGEARPWDSPQFTPTLATAPVLIWLLLGSSRRPLLLQLQFHPLCQGSPPRLPSASTCPSYSPRWPTTVALMKLAQGLSTAGTCPSSNQLANTAPVQHALKSPDGPCPLQLQLACQRHLAHAVYKAYKVSTQGHFFKTKRDCRFT